MRSFNINKTLAFAAVGALLLSGCGGSDSGSEKTTTTIASTIPAKAMDLMMPNSSLPKASTIANNKESKFNLLPTRPPGSDNVTGKAWLAQDGSGTTLTLTLGGLSAGKGYMAHLHAQHCNENNGGPHFQFDPKGDKYPPNEVHVMISADANGKAEELTVKSDRKVGDAAKSVVVHPDDTPDNRMVCADF